MQQWTAEKPCIVISGSLLEGPLYDEKRNKCRFIDIADHKLYTFDPTKGQESLTTITTSDTIGVTANIKGSSTEYIVGARKGFGTLNAKTGEVKYLRKVWDATLDAPELEGIMRSNDGAVDSHGRYWVGTMTNGSRPDGYLFRLDPDLSVHRILDKAIAPNGIGWNKADTVMYWTESGERKIFEFDFAANTGTITERKVFWSTEDNKYGVFATPDGLVIDEDDCIWTALWRGWKVVRINPRGLAIGEIELPTAYVTCPVFVGTQLYIMTARDRDVKEEGIKRGGDVYVVDVGVRGLPKYEFVLKNE